MKNELIVPTEEVAQKFGVSKSFNTKEFVHINGLNLKNIFPKINKLLFLGNSNIII